MGGKGWRGRGYNGNQVPNRIASTDPDALILDNPDWVSGDSVILVKSLCKALSFNGLQEREKRGPSWAKAAGGGTLGVRQGSLARGKGWAIAIAALPTDSPFPSRPNPP